ncbi:MAG TPA: glutamate synthase large subunit [Alphaproteobacteria bacterium]|jgi:glutamate synthase (NADPH/NADH) large chain|nr:glutamate synthase large subunit [Alphaproteobacteria bacterium]
MMPAARGLYDPRNEHDACGVGFVANIKNNKSHAIIAQGLSILCNLEHRGAVGADPLAGDGAGILIQIPDRLFRFESERLGFALPAAGEYAVGMIFMPQDAAARAECEKTLEDYVTSEGQTVLGWRDVPVQMSALGESIKPNAPVIRQVFIGRGANTPDVDAFERKLFVIRKQTHGAVKAIDLGQGGMFYIASLSTRTIIYKGMVIAARLAAFYDDLRDERLESALALVHQRFSTNTFPSWELAHPFRFLAHNGEINTLRGNINWMMARRHSMTSEVLGDDLEKLWPLIGDGNSDSATLDNCLELLLAGGYSLPHALMMMIPEAWSGNNLMHADRRAFYEYHAALMEPWDGPAAIAFTDGRQIGATLDRNGLRPARFVVTTDDIIVMSSEAGVLEFPEDQIVQKWRLEPGKMLLVDLEKGQIIGDGSLKKEIANTRPYQAWLDKTQIRLESLPDEVSPMPPSKDVLLDAQQAFGYTQEDIKVFLKPMGLSGEDALGSMGRDTPLAVLSKRPKLLFDYFQQRFAQVTNPPIDSIREELVMSLVSLVGPRPNLFDLDSGGTHIRLELKQPILSNMDLEKVRRIEDNSGGAFKAYSLPIVYPVGKGAAGMGKAIERICKLAEAAVKSGHNIVILTDRAMDQDHIAVPSLLATAAVHHHLIREGLRTEVGLVVETGEARQLHDFCLLAGYGAEAINPYVALDTLSILRRDMAEQISEYEIHKRYIKAVSKGIMKVMSKMGICTFQSYCGAQIFDAVGLSSAFLDKYFTGTASPIEGAGLDDIAEETARRHALAYGDAPNYRDALDVGGELAYRVHGETHVWTSEVVSLLQHAVRAGDYKQFKQYTKKVGEQEDGLISLRGLLDFDFAPTPIPMDEVESAETIAKRFASGAMSFGSISWEAHTTLAIALNRLGGKSNTGEGGEDPQRYKPLENGDTMRSAIKQVASGRFGVNAEYLVNSDDIQIKMAQGAKPGEGGQLPGHKVDEWIARTRHSVAGVGLISPPPHHDIYSIEDLKQLIHDLKCVNPKARISVKLVSEMGVGTIAAGVAKAKADHVTIAGWEGGTGASPISSIQHAGEPWEIGLAETHQTLVINGLRSRIAVQVDGGVRSGRDVVIGALLGADEFGFATSALIAAGCIMMRKCHLNTCPVGVATQNPELRHRFVGKPEDVTNFFLFIAEEVRELMAKLGFRTFNEMIGQSDRLRQRLVNDPKVRNIDLSKVLYKPEANPGETLYWSETQDHNLEEALDNKLISAAQPAIEHLQPVTIDLPISNVNRTVGALLSGEIARRYGDEGLPNDSIHVNFTGTAGQSFGAFLARGVTMELEGQGNDYVGKGLSGGRLIIYPKPDSKLDRTKAVIVGNTVLYGGVEGECYFSGVGGERFAVRNSGVVAVVEGVGSHGCEYMTGGCVVVLGTTGSNFGAGMSGGVAYVLDEDGTFATRCNQAMVELEPILEEDQALADAEDRGGDLESHGVVELMRNMTEGDARRLRTLIERHVQFTGSPRGQAILADWGSYRAKFVKVMPIEYRRALEQAQPRSLVSVGA